MNLPPFPPTCFDPSAMEYRQFEATQSSPPRADWGHAGRRGVRWNVVGDITHREASSCTSRWPNAPRRQRQILGGD
jgi:hypothetical protein